MAADLPDWCLRKARAYKKPHFVGEFGADASTQGVAAYIAALYDALDAALASGTQWVYTPGWSVAAGDGWNQENMSVSDDRGNVRANFAARAYPRRVAGTPTYFFVDAAAHAVELSWDHVAGAGATEIDVPGALAVEAAPEDALACTIDAGRVVRCTSPTNGTKVLRVVASGF
jgi:hypothetical protein